jgi:hypothetical protein
MPIRLAALLLIAAPILAQTTRTNQIVITCVSASRLSLASESIIYKDCDDGKEYVSRSGGAFAELGSGGGGGTGTVTSVGFSAPAAFSVTGSPITTSGTITLGLQTQTANLIWAGPASGSATTPTFRALVKLDLPASVAHEDDANTFTGTPQVMTGSLGIGSATAPASKLSITATGNGHTAANADNLLSVRGTGSSTAFWRGRIVNGGDNVAFLLGEYNSQAWLGAHNAALNAWRDLYIQPDGAEDTFIGVESSAPLLAVMNSTGRVGIGQSSPTYDLDVWGSTYSDVGSSIASVMQLMNETTAHSATPQSGITFGTKYNSGGSDMASMGGISVGKENATGGDFAGYLALHTRPNGGAIAERMRIDSAGRVGIGVTPSSSTQLHIVGNTADAPVWIRNNHASGFPGFALYDASNTLQMFFGYSNGTSEVRYNAAAGAPHRFRVSSTVMFEVSSSGVKVGSAGTTYTGIYSNSASLNYAQALASTCETLTLSVPSAVEGSSNSVAVGMPTALATHNTTSTFFGWVSAANTVSVRRCVITADGSDPAAATVRATVTMF